MIFFLLLPPMFDAQAHQFFESLDFENIIQTQPCYIPGDKGIFEEEMKDGGADDWYLEDGAVPMMLEPMTSMSSSLDGKLLQEEEETGDAWSQFLLIGERCILSSLVWKRKG